MSQPGLSKQVKDHQHSSEVFSFLFTEEIYIGHIKKKKKHTSKSKSDNTKKKKEKKNRQSLINPNGFVISDTYSDRQHIQWKQHEQ